MDAHDHPTDYSSVLLTTKRARVRHLLETQVICDLRPGEAIPSERELVRRLEVSRVTVRHAIEDLVAEGRLEKSHGRGTFVTGPRIESRLHLMSFSREMRARGLEPQTRVLDACEVPAVVTVAERLGLEAGTPVVRVERLRLADGNPMAHETGFYPAASFPGLLELDLSSLYDIFARHYGKRVTSGEQEIRAEAADTAQANVLGIPRRAPLLVQERVTFAGKETIEFATSHYRGDRYRLQMDLTPSGSR
ncbi:GntR family transcriptional regulator [Ammonicoccus fulvus]|uniref:GntR family transcriptional regulator n=1 Tax=Ammonicoccus fulvus TaxID=3138240 RepID=A0ABZ3FLK9_9ACTN